MKTILQLATLAVLLVAPSPCFALTVTVPVSKERAKEMGMEVRSVRAGPNHVQVELEFKIEGKLKDFKQVDLRIGDRASPSVTAPLREDRSKLGRVVVSFSANRAQLDKLNLLVTVPEPDGRTIYVLRVNDFVDPTPITPGGADERKAPSLEDDAKVLAGKWESTPKGGGRVVLQFEPGKAKTTFSLTAELYDIRAKEPKLVDTDRAETELQDDMGKRFFIREGVKVRYSLKDKKLLMDGEYEANGTL